MATLLLPSGVPATGNSQGAPEVAVLHRWLFIRSDWRQGIQHRRARDLRTPRRWSATWRTATTGQMQLANKLWVDGALGALEWDWVPPWPQVGPSTIKVRVVAFQALAIARNDWEIIVDVQELLSSDTA